MVRQRKLRPVPFLDSLVFNGFDNNTASLNDYSVSLQVRHETFLKKQSIDERFGPSSVAFVKHLLAEQLEKQVSAALPEVCFQKFTSVKIKDSTRFQLPACLKEQYPGSGGAASDAGVHIQFEFDIKQGKVATIEVTDAKRQDWTDAIETIDDIEEGSLLLRDLGYFSTRALEEIGTRRNAFYISRLKPRIMIFQYVRGKFEKLDLAKVHRQMKKAGIPWQELDVYIGEDRKVAVRLLMELMPEEEVQKRLRKANRRAIKRRTPLTAGYKAYASLGLFITNVPKEWMAPEHIRSVYRLRWQIELRFKCWKSLCRIHAIKKMKLHRFETILYARLLHILINWQICMTLLTHYWKTKRQLLSVDKCYKAILQCGDLLQLALFGKGKSGTIFYTAIESINYQSLLLEKKKGHLCLEEILLTDVSKKRL